MQRSVFFVSDGTGITAETLGNALLTQFPGLDFGRVTLPFVDTLDKAIRAADRIDADYAVTSMPPLVFSTLVDPAMRAALSRTQAIVFDFFEPALGRLQTELGMEPVLRAGKLHGVGDEAVYMTRMDAVNFALAHDDAQSLREYARADVIVLGVSRVGKTPTCLYLGLHYGILAANWPLTGEDLEREGLPEALRAWRGRLFGLSLKPERLSEIREQRRPGSRYASFGQCQREVNAALALYRREDIPWLDTGNRSVEEIAATVVERARLVRRFF